MPRTAINIDARVLEGLEAIEKREGASLGTLSARLLAEAIARRRKPPGATRVDWVSRPTGRRVDLAREEALHRALDEDGRRATRSTPSSCSIGF